MNSEFAAFAPEELHWVSVSVPISSFTVPFAREFAESFPFPPPATVYGMLLSYIGETDRRRYVGTQIAIVVTGHALPSVVIRKVRRVKKTDLNDPTNSKPDFQTLLTGLTVLVGIVSGDAKLPGLWETVRNCHDHPESVSRFGGLSCGESHNLVDEFSILPVDTARRELTSGESFVLNPAEQGEWSVPVWVDHVGSAKTIWERAALVPSQTIDRVGVFTIVDTVNRVGACQF